MASVAAVALATSTLIGLGGAPAEAASLIPNVPTDNTAAHVVARADGHEVFFTQPNGQVVGDWYANGQWNGPAPLASAHATGPLTTNPSGTNVFYTDKTNGRIGIAWHDSTGWHNSVIGGSGTHPLVRQTSSIERVFFIDRSGRLANDWHTAGGTWQGPAYVGTAYARGPLTANASGTSVYYTDASSGRVGIAWYNSTGWHNSVLGGSGTNLVESSTSSIERVFFVDSSGRLANDWRYAGGSWQGPGYIANARPAGALTVNPGGTNVFYTDSTNGRVGIAWVDSTGWHNSVVGGSGTNPYVVTTSAAESVFFADTAGRIVTDWHPVNDTWKGPAAIGGSM